MHLPTLTSFARRVRRAFGHVAVARVVVGLWLAVHGGVVAGIPIADALGGHGDAIVAHWEDAQDSSCPPQHDLETCQLCQQIGGAFGHATPQRAPLAPIVHAADVLPRDLGLEAQDALRRGAPHPRGPPRG